MTLLSKIKKVEKGQESPKFILNDYDKTYFQLLEILKNPHCPCIIFILTSYSLYTWVKQNFIYINIQYLKNVVFSFEKGSSGQMQPLNKNSNHSIKKFLSKISKSPQPLIYLENLDYYTIFYCIIVIFKTF